jgi:ATP-dependent RNA helicase DDX51/DBP6
MPFPLSPYSERKESSCQKLLFSATLTRDPDKIAALDLRDPKYFVVGTNKSGGPGDNAAVEFALERFAMPSTLTVIFFSLASSHKILRSSTQEHMIICESSQKPLIFFYLVHSRDVRNALVFTKSAESTTRLVQLFDFFEQARNPGQDTVRCLSACAYSSDLSASERKSILDSFKARDIQMCLPILPLVGRSADVC